MAYLKAIKIEKLWGTERNIIWNNIHQDVNILVGVNGSGKTTLLNLLWAASINDTKLLKKYGIHSLVLEDSKGEVVRKYQGAKIESHTFFKGEFITTFDVIAPKNSKSESPLTQELLDTIYTTGRGSNSFFDYRLKATNFPNQATAINNRIQLLFQLINEKFSSTGKEIRIEAETNKVIFKHRDAVIQLENLSSGEKQFLLIIFKAFLMEEREALLLMDEPEISLDLDWQFALIELVRKLNPNCQIIVSTHSPAIFGDGWSDKVVHMEDLWYNGK